MDLFHGVLQNQPCIGGVHGVVAVHVAVGGGGHTVLQVEIQSVSVTGGEVAHAAVGQNAFLGAIDTEGVVARFVSPGGFLGGGGGVVTRHFQIGGDGDVVRMVDGLRYGECAERVAIYVGLCGGIDPAFVIIRSDGYGEMEVRSAGISRRTQCADTLRGLHVRTDVYIARNAVRHHVGVLINATVVAGNDHAGAEAVTIAVRAVMLCRTAENVGDRTAHGGNDGRTGNTVAGNVNGTAVVVALRKGGMTGHRPHQRGGADL